jgi:hypothetical protein
MRFDLIFFCRSSAAAILSASSVRLSRKPADFSLGRRYHGCHGVPTDVAAGFVAR